MQQDSDESEPNYKLLTSAGKFAGRCLAACFTLAFLVLLGRRLIRLSVRQYRFLHAGRNDKLVMWYHAYIRRRARHEKMLSELLNYREQLRFLARQGKCPPKAQELEKAIAILEQAGFSTGQISEEDFQWTVTFLQSL